MTTIRNCLKCLRKFDSQHKGNRLCGKCNEINTKCGRMDSREGGRMRAAGGRGRVLRKNLDGGSSV